MVPVCFRPPAHRGSGFLDSCAGVVEGGSLRCSVGGATRIDYIHDGATCTDHYRRRGSKLLKVIKLAIADKTK